MEREPDGTLITLLDDDGTEREFEHLASLEHNGSTYVALIPAFQEPEEFVESDGTLVILKVVEDENGEEILSSVDDDDEFEEVAHQFENLLENDYDIVDEYDDEEDAGDEEGDE